MKRLPLAYLPIGPYVLPLTGQPALGTPIYEDTGGF
jgi:hypothetical protein